MRSAALSAALLLAAGACAAPPPSATRPAHEVAFLPDQEGLAVSPTNMRIDFGRSPAGVIATLDRELGPHQVLALEGCPAQVLRHLQWGDLALTFSREQFIGWRQGMLRGGITCPG